MYNAPRQPERNILVVQLRLHEHLYCYSTNGNGQKFSSLFINIQFQLQVIFTSTVLFHQVTKWVLFTVWYCTICRLFRQSSSRK